MDNGSYKFDIQVQKKFLALLFQDFSFLSTNGTEIIKPEYFDTIYLRNVARWIIDYFTKYQTKPTTEVLITELDNYSAKTKVSEIDREQYLDLINYLSTEVVNEGEYLKEQLLEFARSVAFGNALEESFNIYDSDGDYTKAISIMEKALTVGVGSNLGLSLVDCVSDLPERLKSRYDRHNMFRTGIKSLDKALGGGCAKGEVHVMCAPPGGGKSKFLSYLAYQAIFQNRPTVYFSFEWSEDDVIANVMSCLIGMSIHDMIDESKIEEYKRRASKIKMVAPKLRTKYFANKTVNINHLRTYLTKLYSIEKFKPGLIIIDYADLMLPVESTKKRNADSTYEEMGLIFYDLKLLADMFECPVYTASQLNKGVWNMQDGATASQDSLADSSRKAHVAYSIVTINQTDAEKKANKARLYVAKSRKGLTGETVFINYDKSINRVSECEQYDPKNVVPDTTNE